MPDWFTDFLCGISMGVANDIWNFSMGLIGGFMKTTPESFSSSAWNFVTGTLYPWALSIGLSMLNLFFIIAIWQAVKNFHQNITFEMTVEAMIKIAVANIVFVNLLPLMKQFFKAASAMSGEVYTVTNFDLTTSDIDIGSVLFYQLFGIIFIIAAIVCSFLMIMTVYTRYIKLYVLIILAPFAVPTLIGGNGVERTFYSWLRTFLLNCFEIVVIAIVISVSSKIIQGGITLFNATSFAGKLVDGFTDALNALFTMVFMTASVKGANGLLSKAFGL